MGRAAVDAPLGDGVLPPEIVVVDTDPLMLEVTARGSHDSERLHDTGVDIVVDPFALAATTTTDALDRLVEVADPERADDRPAHCALRGGASTARPGGPAAWCRARARRRRRDGSPWHSDRLLQRHDRHAAVSGRSIWCRTFTGIGRGEPQLGLPPAARKLSTARWSRSSAAPYDVKSPVRWASRRSARALFSSTTAAVS